MYSGSPLIRSPIFHSVGYGIGDAAVEGGTVVNHINEFGIYVARQILEHFSRLNTYFAKYSLGRVAGEATSTGFCEMPFLLL